MKIGITGSTCSGKTTFINYLMFTMEGIRDKVEIINERAMECPYPLNDKGGFRTQWWIQSQQILKELEAKNRSEIVITDRTVFDSIPYLQIAPYTNEELDFVVKTAQNWNRFYPYDYVFYFAPIVRLALSDGAHKFQMNIDEKLRRILSYNIYHDKIIYIPYNKNKIKRCNLAYSELLHCINGE